MDNVFRQKYTVPEKIHCGVIQDNILANSQIVLFLNRCPLYSLVNTKMNEIEFFINGKQYVDETMRQT